MFLQLSHYESIICGDYWIWINYEFQLGTFGSLASLLAATIYQGNNDSKPNL
jgi:hypothetical protein